MTHYEKQTFPILVYSADESRTPVYSSENAAGADLKSAEELVIPAGEHRLVKTGIKLVMPPGYVGLVHPRSGLALKHGITVLNTPGTIDSDYRGEIGVILYNTSERDFYVGFGDRIAQLVFQRYEEAKFYWGGVDVPKDADTERGDGGFGSTGIGEL
jgi:dUTP pyrophosphatase